MKNLSELAEESDPNCTICKGQGWVCENHPFVSWDGGEQTCCNELDGIGAGMPCTCSPLHHQNHKGLHRIHTEKKAK
jgi:hypothetical protein